MGCIDIDMCKPRCCSVFIGRIVLSCLASPKGNRNAV